MGDEPPVTVPSPARVAERLPQAESVNFDAAYRPAHEPGDGHDWYDAFPLPDGRFALSIGDVAGPGVPAARVIDEVRGALRAAARDASSPAAILERANALVNATATPVTVSATFGIVDPATATITYAAAGNPPPLLALPCMLVQSLPAGDIPLGVAHVLGAGDWSFTIPPGAYFIVYTEGLIERSRSAELAAALRAEIAERNDAPAQSLLRRVFADRTEGNEAAAVCVTARDAPARDLHFDFSAVPLAVPIARRTLLRYAQRIGLDDDARYALITAAGEAMANAVEHAYSERPGIVRLAVAHTPAALQVTVEDDGNWKAPHVSSERGRGLPIMRSLMDAVEVRTESSHTTIRLTLYNSPQA